MKCSEVETNKGKEKKETNREKKNENGLTVSDYASEEKKVGCRGEKSIACEKRREN